MQERAAHCAYNFGGKTAAVGITTGHRTRRQAASRLTNSLQHMFILATILFFVLPPNMLDLIGWQYVGGGAEYQKIHIATYLLIATFVGLWLNDTLFRENVTRLCTDGTLMSFAFVVLAIASYAIGVKHESITPFVDTFFAALLTAIGWISLPPESLSRLRYLLDILFVTNIAIMFLEYGTNSHLAPHVQGADVDGFRADALFGHPLLASYLLGVYSMANFVSMPVKLTWACIVRLSLGFASLFAILITGGRTAIVTTILILLAFFAVSAIRQIMSGRINRAALVYSFLGLPAVVICAVALLQLGVFDTILGRFEYDNGSASARGIALDLVLNMPTDGLWFGMSPSDILAFDRRQEELNLVAIEISWASFVLACGLVFTVPLFATYSLFLVRFIPRYSAAPAILPGVFLLLVTATSNSIWTKTTLLTMSFAVILAFFRRSSSERSVHIRKRALLSERRVRMEC